MMGSSRFSGAACLLLILAGSAQARKRDEGAMTTAPVSRPVVLRVETASADVDVRRGTEPKIVVSVDDDGGAHSVKLVGSEKDVLTALFDGQGMLPSGRVRLLVPAGTRLDVRTASGDIKVRDLGAWARVHSLSGDIRITGALGADVSTVSGDLNLEGSGNFKVKTVSGDVQVRDQRPAGTGAVIEMITTSGDLSWSGVCGGGCRLSATTVSGDVQLAFDPRSSFAFSGTSHSGELDDDVGLQIKESGNRQTEGSYGKGEGRVETRTFSGDTHLYKR